jgi:tRNA threonylcarbamoyladenosine biosynthesis protein TsaE
MKTVSQPREQPGFGRRKIDAGHADLGKSEFAGPVPHLRQNLRTVTLTAVEHHAPIVGTPAPRQLVWGSEDDTRAFAERLAARPGLGEAFIALHGDLGAGKTTLVRHLLRALGAQGRIKSPTYAVVEPYELDAFPAWHFDFYRFDDPREWEDAGFRDIFAGPGLKLAEWPDKAAAVLPPADLDLHITLRDDDTRLVTLTPHGARGLELAA